MYWYDFGRSDVYVGNGGDFKRNHCKVASPEEKEKIAKLFSEHLRGTALINADDPVSEDFARAAIRSGNDILRFSTLQKADFYSENISYTRDEHGLGASFALNANGERYSIVHHFPGDFGVANAIAAAAVCKLCGAELRRVVLAYASATNEVSGVSP